MHPQKIIYLIQLAKPFLLGPEKTNSLPVHIQVLTGLRLYATSSYQKVISQVYTHPTSQPTVCRIIEAFTNTLYRLSPLVIRFPTTPEKQQEVQAR